MIVVVDDDDENGKVEGNLVMAASHVSPEDVAFMVKHGSGIVSVGMRGEDLERLNLPLISHQNEDNPSAPSFTITVVYIYIFIYITLLQFFYISWCRFSFFSCSFDVCIYMYICMYIFYG